VNTPFLHHREGERGGKKKKLAAFWFPRGKGGEKKRKGKKGERMVLFAGVRGKERRGKGGEKKGGEDKSNPANFLISGPPLIIKEEKR